MNPKVKAARLSILSNTLLVIIKFASGILSGSISIISEAIHSCMDLAAAVIAFFSVKISDNPPDEEHQYGHGKVENISGVVEALLIFVAAALIISESVKKIINPGETKFALIGIIVMAISAIVNFFVSRLLYKTAKETDSVALEADALHLKTDVYTSAGVVLGLIVIWITGIKIIDPIVAILVAMLIIYEAYELLKRAYSPLLDAAMNPEDKDMVVQIIKSHNLPFHCLRTRKAGKYKFVDIHIEMSANLILEEVHSICDKIENDIKNNISNIDINIHVEPIKLPKED